jgi:hypothetical protein
LEQILAAGNFAFRAYQQRWLPQLDDDLKDKEVQAKAVKGPDWTFPDDHSGWYVDQLDMAVAYRPIGHADPVIKGMLDALSEPAPSKTSTDDAASHRANLRHKILEKLIGPGGFARSSCLSCHQVEPDTGIINWAAANRSNTISGFSKFNHRPHMTMLRDSDNCSQCHKQPDMSDPKTATMVLSRGQFLPHNQSTCAGCHTPTQANNSCLNCHVYHQQRP